MSSQHLQIRTKTEFSVVIQCLESLIECLKRGTIFITHDGKSIQLKPQEPISMDLAAEVKPDHSIFREKIVLKLQWEIRETWSHGKEFFSLSDVDLTDSERRDLPLSSRKSDGKKRRGEKERQDKSDTLKSKMSPKRIGEKSAQRGAQRSNSSVLKKRR